MTHIPLTVPKPQNNGTANNLHLPSKHPPTFPPQLAPFPPGTAVEAGPGNSRGLSTEHTLELGISPTPHHAKMSTSAATTVSEHPSEHSATWFYGVPLAARGSKLTHRVSFSRGSVSKRFPPRKEATARKSLRVTCASVAAPIGCLLVKLRRTKKKKECWETYFSLPIRH